MKRLFSAIVLLVMICTAFCQENNVYKYYKYVNKAELSRDLEHNKKANKYYEKAFKYNKPFFNDVFQYLWIYANYHYGNESNALKYAKYNAQREMLWAHLLKDDSTFYHNICLIEDTTASTIIPSLKHSLDSLMHIDQEFRLDSTKIGQLATIDSMNMQKLMELFETYGYINEDNAGQMAVNDIQMIFIHYSKTQSTEPPFYILENAVKHGTLDAREYIYLYDLCQYFHNDIFHPSDTLRRNSRFGTDMNQHKIIGDMLFIYPPENIKKVNANRKSILMAETWKDYEKKLIKAFLNDGAGFVQVTPITFGSREEESEQQNKLKQEIDSGKVKGKYIKGEKIIFPMF